MSKTVINGVLQRTSPSALEMADTRDGGCLRKWWYRYVWGIKEDEGIDAIRGTRVHDHLSTYLPAGQLPPNPATLADEELKLAAEMAHKAIAGGIVPRPGPDLLVEQSINGWGLVAGGVPVNGKIDLLHARGENVGVSDVEDTFNPPGTLVVRDWKCKNSKATTAKTTRYLQTPETLPRTIQMAAYGLAADLRFPGYSHVRVEHGYIFTKSPGPRVVTRLTVIDELKRTWEYADGLARSLVHVAAQTDVERVDANRFACERYGPKYRCIHAPYCTGFQNNALTLIYGEQPKMSLMNTLTGTPQVGAAVGANGAVNSLATEEAALRHAQALIAQGQTGIPTPAATPPAAIAAPGAFQPAGIPTGFESAWRAILAANSGQPALAGDAAAALAMVCGQQIQPGASYAGVGPLAQITLQSATDVLRLAGDFGWRPAAPAPAPMMPAIANIAPMAGVSPGASATVVQSAAPATTPSILPPDAPAPATIAARPLEFAVPASTITNVLNNVAPGLGTAVVGSLPRMTETYVAADTTAAPAPAVQMSNVAPPEGHAARAAAMIAAETATPAKRGRGRPRKADTAPNTPAAQAPASAPPDSTAVELSGYPLEVFVDCYVGGDTGDIASLDAYINTTVGVLVQRYCPPPAIPDIRCAPNDGPLGYGRWKGALAQVVREVPPPPGRYTLHVGTDEIRTEVANALRQVCAVVDGLFVDGRR